MRPTSTAAALLIASSVAIFPLALDSAAAQPYESSGLTLSNPSPPPGGSETVTAKGFRPGSTISVVILSSPVTLGTTTVDANGIGISAVTIPPTFAPGSSHTIEANGNAPTGSPLTESASLTLAAPAAAGLLALTGAQVVGLATAGGAILAAGTALVVISRRRRRPSP